MEVGEVVINYISQIQNMKSQNDQFEEKKYIYFMFLYLNRNITQCDRVTVHPAWDPVEIEN